jgi:hypothetical protein
MPNFWLEDSLYPESPAACQLKVFRGFIRLRANAVLVSNINIQIQIFQY